MYIYEKFVRQVGLYTKIILRTFICLLFVYYFCLFLESPSRPGFEYFHIISMPVTVPFCLLHKLTYCHFRLQYIFALNALDYGTKAFLFLRYRVHFVPVNFVPMSLNNFLKFFSRFNSQFHSKSKRCSYSAFPFLMQLNSVKYIKYLRTDRRPSTLQTGQN